MRTPLDVIGEWVRPYQAAWVLDSSRRKIFAKSRQVGISTGALGLECALLASGLLELADPEEFYTHNVILISRRDREAKKIIDFSGRWLEILRGERELRPWLEANCTAHRIRFARSGFEIVAETQSEDAGRSLTGHVRWDEVAYSSWKDVIWGRNVKSTTISNPRLTIGLVSTFNGVGDVFEEIWSDTQRYPDWSRHRIDVHEAIAVGFPTTFEEAASDMTSDEIDQELLCKPLGAGDQIFTSEMISQAHGSVSGHRIRRVLGLDVASVTDLTAAQVLDEYPDGKWLADTYIVSGVPYKTPLDGSFVGQDQALAALIRHVDADVVSIDITDEKAREWRGLDTGLMQRLQVLCPGVTVIPRFISREWKESAVGSVRDDLRIGVLRFEESRRDLVFRASEATRWLDRDRIRPEDSTEFVRGAFEDSPVPHLTRDFRQVHRKWTRSGATYDTTRDNRGHGDSFWAAVIAYSVSREVKIAQQQQETRSAASRVRDVKPQAPKFSGYL